MQSGDVIERAFPMERPAAMKTAVIRKPLEMNHRTVLAIALPIMLSNVSEPLIGVVDTAILGQLGDAYYIGAIAVGSVIFSFLFWSFGFLRMGTSGLTAQAEGAGDDEELRAVLGRALLIAGACGAGMVLFGPLIATVAFWAVEGSAEVEAHARVYFDIRIWSAPASLANYVLLGWFIGMGRTGRAFVLQLLLNLLNVFFDAALVLGLGMGVEGVAIGTVLAQYISVAAGAVLVARELSGRSGKWSWVAVAVREKIRRMVVVNTDIMLRSLCLIFSFAWFTAQGAKSGDTVLAANAVLFNLFLVVTYMLDGFATAAEALAGQSAGAGSLERFRRAVRISSFWAVICTALMGAGIWLAGGWGIDLLTVNEEVRATARVYLFWAALAPVLGIACFLYDGIYIGVTRTADMRNMMFISTAVYLAAWWPLTEHYGNHGLWASLMVFFVMRGLTLGVRYPALVRATFP